MKVVHEWLRDYIGEEIPDATEIERLLTFYAFEIEGVEEVAGHQVIDVDVLPNRSSDCLCHRGIAREIATLLNRPLAHDPLASKKELGTTDAITINIEDTEACPRFTASLITGITVKESPEWLQKRLEALGQRSINNIVDATNYVMLAIGQPLHAYDADRFPQVDGTWQFDVRYAKAGEMVSLIAESGKEEDRDVELIGTEVLVVDGSSNTPIGLAGVKGGRYAGVDEETTNVIIEAAHWNPNITRKTARRLGIVIDASKRFENECSRELPPYAQAEIIQLIIDIAGGVCQGMTDVYPVPYEPTEVMVQPDKANSLLGLSLTAGEMEALIRRTGSQVKQQNGELVCTGPFERTDLVIEEDFIEEIGRIYGYDHIESVVPEAVKLSEVNGKHYYSEVVREALLASGFSEVITSSFRQKDTIKLRNALASDKAHLRSSLTRNITETLDKNATFTDLLGTNDTKVFEIGTVFDKTDQGIVEHTALAVGVRLRPSGYSGKEDSILNDTLVTVAEALGVKIDWSVEKGVAETNLSAALEVLPVPSAYARGEKSVDIQYQPFSTYPHMSRDIAMWITDKNDRDTVVAALNEAAGELRVRTTFVDEFEKDGRTSLAFRLVFQSKEKTLTDETVNAIMDNIYAAVRQLGCEVR